MFALTSSQPLHDKKHGFAYEVGRNKLTRPMDPRKVPLRLLRAIHKAFLIAPLLVCAAVPAFAQLQPVPQISSPVVPAAAAPGGSAFTPTVNGKGFTSSSVVEWNGNPLGTTFVSRTRLTASISALNITNVGTAEITVVNPGPGAGTSNVVFSPITTQARALTFTSVDCRAGTNPQSLIVGDFNGDGFTSTKSPTSSRRSDFHRDVQRSTRIARLASEQQLIKDRYATQLRRPEQVFLAVLDCGGEL